MEAHIFLLTRNINGSGNHPSLHKFLRLANINQQLFRVAWKAFDVVIRHNL